MKRVLTFLAIMLLPLSVMAMTPVTDSDLSGVTGQAGVNINADLTMDIEIGTMAWGDSSGMDFAFGWDTVASLIEPVGLGAGNDSAGYIGMNNFNITNLRIQARVWDSYNGYDVSDHTPGGNGLKPITIDVATGGDHPGVTFVRFGLGSLEITMDDLYLDVALGSTTTLDQKLGEVYIGDLAVYINPDSYVDLYNGRVGSDTCGVTMDIHVKFDHIGLSAVSWGDSDGILNDTANGSNYNWMTGTAAAGYIGLTNISMGVVSIDGAVNIDVTSVADGAYFETAEYIFNTYGPGLIAAARAANPTLGGAYSQAALEGLMAPASISVVHISFGDGTNPFVIDVTGPITADVKIGAAPELPYDTNIGTAGFGTGLNATKELGDIYLSGLKVTIADGSWVDIWAH